MPGAAAIEKYMRDVGVSSKQTDKARQVFLRSARQANFFEHGEDRLVRPAAQPGPGTPPLEERKEEIPEPKPTGSGDGMDGLDLDPLLIALLKKILQQRRVAGIAAGSLVSNIRDERLANL